MDTPLEQFKAYLERENQKRLDRLQGVKQKQTRHFYSPSEEEVRKTKLYQAKYSSNRNIFIVAESERLTLPELAICDETKQVFSLVEIVKDNFIPVLKLKEVL